MELIPRGLPPLCRLHRLQANIPLLLLFITMISLVLAQTTGRLPANHRELDGPKPHVKALQDVAATKILNRRLGDMISDSELSDRISMKHKFTFTVNGKELALEPPIQSLKANLSAPGSVSDSPFGSAELPKAKLSRLGDFVSPVDYDSGFDSGSEAESNVVGSTGSQLQAELQPNKPARLVNVRAFQGESSRPSFGSSSSSALMSPGGQGVDDNADNGSESQAAANNMSTPSRSVGERNHTRIDPGEPNKIISDWPKANGNSRQSASLGGALATPDRYSAKVTSAQAAVYRALSSQASRNPASPARFSSLLSGSSGATASSGGFNGSNGNGNSNSNHNSNNNEATNQSADQQAWDAKQLRKSPAPQSKFATKVGNTEILTGPLTASEYELPVPVSKTNIKRNAYPRAPVVYAKARHTPSIVGQSSSFSGPPSTGVDTVSQVKTSFDLNKGDIDDGLIDNKQTQLSSDNQASNELAPFHSHVQQLTKFNHNNKPINPGKAPIAGKPDHLALSITEVNHKGDQRSETHIGTLSEYKTNFTDYTPTPKHSSSTRRQKLSTSGDTITTNRDELSHSQRVSARDLLHKLEPVAQTGNYASGLGRPFGQQDISSLKFSSALSSAAFVPHGSISGNSTPTLLSPSQPSSSSSSSLSSVYSQQQQAATRNGQQLDQLSGSSERVGSIVRSGSIMPSATGVDSVSAQSNYGGFLPALLAQTHDEQRLGSSAGHKLRSFLANQQVSPDVGSLGIKSQSLHIARADRMMATANQLGVTHLGPQGGGSMGDVGHSGYSNDYSSSRQLSSSGTESSASSIEPGMQNSMAGNARLPSLSDEQRGSQSDNQYQGDLSNGYDPPSSSTRGQKDADQVGADHMANSRSSISDAFMRSNPKTREASNLHPLRSSMDPFEDVAGGVVSSDYERELADLDEEFSRHSGAYSRRPSAGSLMSDSFLSLSPEKYEARRYTRRPYGADFPGDYLATAGSMSTMVPRAYPRALPWVGGSHYADGASDLWADSSVDFSPLGSYMSPHYSQYRYRPRYQRVSPYGPSSSYLAASASEHQLQPAYNLIPAASYAAPVPTETISFALSPLAAAAAAAASAIVAADKSRHQGGHGWLTLPRFTSASLSTGSTSGATQASSAAPTSALPATAAIQAAYIQRAPTPGAYALNSVPIYAIGPRPGAPAPLATAASGANPAILPYFHGGAPAIIAYRPASVVPSASLLTAASFAYPLRLPTATSLGRPTPIAIGGSARSMGLRPAVYADLQLSESKSKSNLTHSNGAGNADSGATNSNNSNNNSSKGAKSVSLSAMARNLTRKMFGSASQMRPLHVAPPSLDLFGSLSQQGGGSAPANSTSQAGSSGQAA